MLPSTQINDLFNQGLRIAIVEVFDPMQLTFQPLGVYQRVTQDYYLFYENFLQQMSSSENGAIGVDFNIYSTVDDLFVSNAPWGACAMDFTGIGFPAGCDPSAEATDPTVTNKYIQFTDNSAGNMKGFTDVKVSILSGGNCSATEKKFVIYSVDNSPQSDQLQELLAINPALDLSTLDYMTCSDCVSGQALIINTRNTHSGVLTLTCPEYYVPCNYTCPFRALSDTSSLEAQSSYIYEVFQDPLWDQYFADQGVSIVPVFKKRDSVEAYQSGSVKDITLNVTNCTNLPNVVNFINNFIKKTMPGSTLQLKINGCSVVSDIPQQPNLIPLVALVAIVPLVIIGLVLWKLYSGYSWMSHLPNGVAWSFLNHNFNFGVGWDQIGSSDSYYYSKVYSEGSADYKRALALFQDFLGGGELIIVSIRAIFNPVLLRQFINQWELTTERLTTGKAVFGKTTYSDNPNQMWIVQKFNERAHHPKLSWNKDLTCPIIPTAHGTELYLAEKISQTGFANLSKLDAGYFGSGIYFSTFVMYTLPYFASKKKPSVIVSYVIPGNIYPVKEHHKSPESLLGKPLQSGYNSHYIVTTKSGTCISEEREGATYDELVIPLEGQIVPAFIFEISNENFKDLNASWDREVEEESRYAQGRSNLGRGNDGRDFRQLEVLEPNKEVI